MYCSQLKHKDQLTEKGKKNCVITVKTRRNHQTKNPTVSETQHTLCSLQSQLREVNKHKNTNKPKKHIKKERRTQMEHFLTNNTIISSGKIIEHEETKTHFRSENKQGRIQKN